MSVNTRKFRNDGQNFPASNASGGLAPGPRRDATSVAAYSLSNEFRAWLEALLCVGTADCK